MLYDNALLARAYLHGWQVTGEPLFRSVCEETLDWALRELRGPEGGFQSALDADSEGVEGRFYVWRLEELAMLAGERGRAAWFGASRERQLRGREHPRPRRAASPRRSSANGAGVLYEARARRVWPGLDDKRLTSWNALMISALAEAGAVLGREDCSTRPRDCAELRAGRAARRERQAAAHAGRTARPS